MIQKGDYEFRLVGHETEQQIIEQSVSAGESILLVGPVGVGKSKIVEHIMDARGWEEGEDYVFFPMTRGVKPSDIHGVDMESLLEGEVKGTCVFPEEIKCIIVDEVGRGDPRTVDDAFSKLLEERKIYTLVRNQTFVFTFPEDMPIVLISNPVGVSGVEGLYEHSANRIDKIVHIGKIEDYDGLFKIAQSVFSRDLDPGVKVSENILRFACRALCKIYEEKEKLDLETVTPRFFESIVKDCNAIAEGKIGKKRNPVKLEHLKLSDLVSMIMARALWTQRALAVPTGQKISRIRGLVEPLYDEMVEFNLEEIHTSIAEATKLSSLEEIANRVKDADLSKETRANLFRMMADKHIEIVKYRGLYQNIDLPYALDVPPSGSTLYKLFEYMLNAVEKRKRLNKIKSLIQESTEYLKANQRVDLIKKANDLEKEKVKKGTLRKKKAKVE